MRSLNAVCLAFNENELRIRVLLGDTCKYFVMLGQCLEQRMRKHVDSAIVRNSEIVPAFIGDRLRWLRHTYAYIGKSNQYFRIMTVAIRRLHHFARDEIIHSRQPRAYWMSPSKTLNGGKSQRSDLCNHDIHTELKIN